MQKLFYIVAIFIVSSCLRPLRVSEIDYMYVEVSTTKAQKGSEEIEDIVKPYRQRMQSEMSVILGRTLVPLERAQPEGRLGNFLADLLVEEVQEESSDKIDLCILNYGGLRIPILDTGNITLGLVYELMPFDNTIIISKVKGADLLQLIRHMVKQGGWPVSSGLEVIVNGSGDIYTLINGKRIDLEKDYHLVSNNYIANGGDGCFFMLAWDNYDTGWLLRDKIIEYLNELSGAGGVVYSELTSRVVFF